MFISIYFIFKVWPNGYLVFSHTYDPNMVSEPLDAVAGQDCKHVEVILTFEWSHKGQFLQIYPFLGLSILADMASALGNIHEWAYGQKKVL